MVRVATWRRSATSPIVKNRRTPPKAAASVSLSNAPRTLWGRSPICGPSRRKLHPLCCDPFFLDECGEPTDCDGMATYGEGRGRVLRLRRHDDHLGAVFVVLEPLNLPIAGQE